MASRTRTALLADIVATIVAGAPGSITEAEVQQLLRDIVDSSIGTVVDAEIQLQGKPYSGPTGVFFHDTHSLGALTIHMAQRQSGIHVYNSTPGGGRLGLPIAFFDAPGATVPQWFLAEHQGQYMNKIFILSGDFTEPGTGEGAVGMMGIWSDVGPPYKTLVLRSSPLGNDNLGVLDTNGVLRSVIFENGEFGLRNAGRGIRYTLADGRVFRAFLVDNAGTIAWSFEDLAGPALPDDNPDASIATLVTNWNAAQPGVEFLSMWAGWAGVTSAAGKVTQYADLMGRVGAPGNLVAAVGNEPDWDAVNQIATFGAGELLATANNQWLRHSHALSLILVGKFPDVASSYWPIRISGAGGFDRHFGIKVEGAAPSYFRGVYGAGPADPGVNAGTNRRLLILDCTNVNPNPFGIEIPNDTRVFNEITPHSAAEDNAVTVAPSVAGAEFNMAAVVYGVPNAAQITVLKNFLNGLASHAPVYV